MTSIIINGKPFQILVDKLTYGEIVQLYYTYMLPTITFSKEPKGGTIAPGEFVDVTDDLVINIAFTNKA